MTFLGTGVPMIAKGLLTFEDAGLSSEKSLSAEAACGECADLGTKTNIWS